MSVTDAAASALLQLVALAGVPFLVYLAYQRWRHKRTLREIASRAGFQVGVPKYLIYSAGFALLGIVVLVIWAPPLEPLTRQGSAQRQFVGLGLGARAITLAFLNGVVQTALLRKCYFEA